MISLNGALRTCKVNTGYANRLESDRFENSDLMVCPVWNGHDLAGRPVCADSYATKLAGCNVASDRVVVENAHRPSYAEYIQLNVKGLDGPLYGSDQLNVSGARAEKALQESFPQQTGRFNTTPSIAQVGEATCNNNYRDSRPSKEGFRENLGVCPGGGNDCERKKKK